jgi:hypothetical protein
VIAKTELKCRPAPAMRRRILRMVDASGKTISDFLIACAMRLGAMEAGGLSPEQRMADIVAAEMAQRKASINATFMTGAS